MQTTTTPSTSTAFLHIVSPRAAQFASSPRCALVHSRRVCLRLMSLLATAPALAALSPAAPICTDSPHQLARFIRQNCRPFLELVPPRPSAPQLLWRGDDTHSSCPAQLISQPSDLLDDVTYGPQGVTFFTQLERNPNVLVKPSRSHIATGSRHIAAQWGPPVSVWPVGPFSYAYMYRGSLLYNAPETLQQGLIARGPLVYNQNLQNAIRDGKEIMFDAEQFLLIREQLIPRVLHNLAILHP